MVLANAVAYDLISPPNKSPNTVLANAVVYDLISPPNKSPNMVFYLHVNCLSAKEE